LVPIDFPLPSSLIEISSFLVTVSLFTAKYKHHKNYKFNAIVNQLKPVITVPLYCTADLVFFMCNSNACSEAAIAVHVVVNVAAEMPPQVPLAAR